MLVAGRWVIICHQNWTFRLYSVSLWLKHSCQSRHSLSVTDTQLSVTDSLSLCDSNTVVTHVTVSLCDSNTVVTHVTVSLCDTNTVVTHVTVSLCDWNTVVSHVTVSLCDWNTVVSHVIVSLCDWNTGVSHVTGFLCDWNTVIRKVTTNSYIIIMCKTARSASSEWKRAKCYLHVSVHWRRWIMNVFSSLEALDYERFQFTRGAGLWAWYRGFSADLNYGRMRGGGCVKEYLSFNSLAKISVTVLLWDVYFIYSISFFFLLKFNCF